MGGQPRRLGAAAGLTRGEAPGAWAQRVAAAGNAVHGMGSGEQTERGPRRAAGQQQQQGERSAAQHSALAMGSSRPEAVASGYSN